MSARIPLYEDPNTYDGSDSERIQQAVDAAAAGNGRVIIPRRNTSSRTPRQDQWLLDQAIALPSDICVELDGCHLKLSDACRDNFFRSANCGVGIDPILPAKNIHLFGRNGAVLEGADRPRSSGDHAKVLGDLTFGTDAGRPGESPRGDWRNIGVLLAHVSHFSVQNLRIVDSHCWGISLEYCAEGTLRDLTFRSFGKKRIGGREEILLNQDGVDLRQGCHDILIENICGQTGDDLIALTAIPDAARRDGNLNSTMISADRQCARPGIHNIILRNIRGHCAGGHHIVRLLNTRGLPMENILVDGILDTSRPPYQSKAALKIGDATPAYGGVNPPGTTRRIMVSRIISRAKYAVLVSGSLWDSSFSDIAQYGGDDREAVHFEVSHEDLRNNLIQNARVFPDERIATSSQGL